MAEADSAVSGDASADYWEGQATSFDDLVAHARDQDGIWPAIFNTARAHPQFGPIMSEIDRRRGSIPPFDAVSGFSVFVQWWALHAGMPPDMDPQSPTAVNAWLVRLAEQVASLWTWYLAKLAARGETASSAGVFDPVAQRAREVVVGLTASTRAPLPPTGSTTGLGVFATQQYLRDELRPYLRTATGLDDRSSPRRPSKQSRPAVPGTPTPAKADPALVSILYDPNTSRDSCFVNSKRLSDLPASVQTVLNRVLIAALAWRSKEVRKLTATDVDEPDAFEDVSNRGVPSSTITAKAEGDTHTIFLSWWDEHVGDTDRPLTPAGSKQQPGHKLVRWRVQFPASS